VNASLPVGLNVNCSICGKEITDEDGDRCKECLKYVHKRHMKGDVCCQCEIKLMLSLEKLERKGYLKTK
jgi:methionyl-tRNA synthetase